jgi:hypothetical protein
MKLAAISGVNGPFSDADIRRVRRLALEARSEGAPKRERASVPKRIVTRRGKALVPSKKQAGRPGAVRRRVPGARGG